jgi:type II secretory pathway component PulF
LISFCSILGCNKTNCINASNCIEYVVMGIIIIIFYYTLYLKKKKRLTCQSTTRRLRIRFFHGLIVKYLICALLISVSNIYGIMRQLGLEIFSMKSCGLATKSHNFASFQIEAGTHPNNEFLTVNNVHDRRILGLLT